VGFGLSKNVPPFCPICHQLSPSSHSQHLKISFYFFCPSFPESSSFRPFQFLSEDLFWASYPLPFSPGDPTNLSFIHFTIFSPLLNSSSSRFVLLFHSPFSYCGPYILLNSFLSKISRACPSFFVIVHVSTPYATIGLISVFYSRILVARDKNLFLKRLIAAKISYIAGQNTYLYCILYAIIITD